MRFLSWYNDRLKSHPMVTNCVTSALICGVGDVCAQTIFRRFTCTVDKIPHRAPDETSALVLERPGTGMLDLRRTAVFMSYAFCLGTPLWLTLYGQLDRLVPRRTLAAAFQKGVCTWCFGFISSPVFVTYMRTMDTLVVQGKSPRETASIIRSELYRKMVVDLPRLQGYGLMYWSLHWVPLFYLLPHHVRLVYSSFCQVGWSTISSWIVHRNEDTDHGAAQDEKTATQAS